MEPAADEDEAVVVHKFELKMCFVAVHIAVEIKFVLRRPLQ